MRANLYYLAIRAADQAPPTFNPERVLDKSEALATGALSLVLIVISLIAGWSAGLKGNPARAAAIVAAVLICLIPAGIGLTYSMKSFLPGLTGWLF